jgi:hypothetical protein
LKTIYKSFLCSIGIGLLTTGIFAQPSVEVEGVIKNGTTGKPVKGQRVILLSPSQGMEEVSSVVSDNAGRFKFEKAQGPFFVVQTRYQGANYNQPVRPQDRGPTETNVTVFEATTSEANVSVRRAQWRLVPDSGRLKIDEVFEVVNTTDPPRTLVRADGTFKFGVPAGATVESSSLDEGAGMPLPQTPRAVEAGELFAIDHPIQPGTTRIGVRFDAAYGSQRFEFSQTLSQAIGEIDLFIPEDMQIKTTLGFDRNSEVTQGFQVWVARNKRVNDTIALQVSGGTAPAAEAPGEMGGDEGEGQSAVQTLPNAIGALQIPLTALLGLIVLWSLGFVVFQRTGSSKKSEGLSAEKRKQWIEQKEYLVRRIIELDAKFESKGISDRDYHLQRSRLKSKCAELVRRLEPASTRKRDKTVA